MKQINQLIPVISNLPIVEKIPLSILEIGKHPHLENVISNYLAYYFQKNNSHDLNDLFLKSLFDSLELKSSYFTPERVEVYREVSTKNKKRIDILIVTDNHVIAIECKIFHKLDNPLKDYNEYLKINYDTKQKIKIVLSLFAESPKEEFKNLIFEVFCKNILENLKNYSTQVNSFHSAFVVDLTNTLKNLKSGNMDEKIVTYMSQNVDEFSKIYTIFKQYFKAINTKLTDLNKVLSLKDYCISKEIWNNENIKKHLQSVLIINLKSTDNIPSLCLKIRLSPNGWNLELWNTSNLQKEKKEKLAKHKEDIKFNETNDEYILIEHKEFSTPYTEIKLSAEQIIKKLYED